MQERKPYPQASVLIDDDTEDFPKIDNPKKAVESSAAQMPMSQQWLQTTVPKALTLNC
jgi:hypothetical protein